MRGIAKAAAVAAALPLNLCWALWAFAWCHMHAAELNAEEEGCAE